MARARPARGRDGCWGEPVAPGEVVAASRCRPSSGARPGLLCPSRAAEQVEGFVPLPAASPLLRRAVLGLYQNKTQAVSEETELPQLVFPLPPAPRLPPLLAVPSAHGLRRGLRGAVTPSSR